MQISNIVEFKLSKDLVEYDSAIEFMNTHIDKMKNNAIVMVLEVLDMFQTFSLDLNSLLNFFFRPD